MLTDLITGDWADTSNNFIKTQIMAKEKTKVFNASLTPTEIKRLEEISKEVLGAENKSGIIRYWINKFKSKN